MASAARKRCPPLTVPATAVPVPSARDDVRPYLSAEQLCELTPWTPDAIEKMVKRGVFVRGVHYFQPFGRRSRLIFKWEAVAALVEGRLVHGEGQPVVDGARVTALHSVRAKRMIDVEKATTDLQRMLG